MRHTQKVRPQVQQAAIFLIIVTPCNTKPGLPEQALLSRRLIPSSPWR